MMQIKANIARMKYRSMCSDLKQKSVLYASSLKNLEDEIKEQESEIKRLQASHDFNCQIDVSYELNLITHCLCTERERRSYCVERSYAGNVDKRRN